MGYTHYWYRPRLLDALKFRAFRIDLEKVVWRSGVNVVDVALTDEGVLFAGGCEALKIDQAFAGRSVRSGEDRCFDFCKTEGMKYDALVVAALLLAKMHFGSDFNLTSDGRLDKDPFKCGVALLRDILGIETTYCFKDIDIGDGIPSSCVVAEFKTVGKEQAK